VTRDDLVFTEHAVDRMAEEGIVVSQVIQTVEAGEVIESYPTDVPYPSQLSLAMVKGTPVHTVWAVNPNTRKVIIITTYVPKPERWEADFRTRKRKP
jgi:hypothetical protein